jgi:hypothetical protein
MPPFQISSCPMSLLRMYPTPIGSRFGRPYLPRWFTLSRGRLYEQCAVTITLGMWQLVDNRVPTRGGVDRTQGSSRRATKDVGYGNMFQKTTRTGFFRRRMILRIAAARPYRSSGCDRPPSCVAFSLPSRGGVNSHGCRQLASSIPWCYFPDVRRHLQHSRPTAYPYVPFFAKNISQTSFLP